MKGKQEGVETLWEYPGNVGPSPLAIPTRRVWLGLLSFSYEEICKEHYHGQTKSFYIN